MHSKACLLACVRTSCVVCSLGVADDVMHVNLDNSACKRPGSLLVPTQRPACCSVLPPLSPSSCSAAVRVPPPVPGGGRLRQGPQGAAEARGHQRAVGHRAQQEAPGHVLLSAGGCLPAAAAFWPPGCQQLAQTWIGQVDITPFPSGNGPTIRWHREASRVGD